ncbi:hypothetical protein HDU93_006911, partial [Gonapodya sp. JEL0774]
MVYISDDHLREVDTKGFTIIPGFLTPAEVAAAQDGLWWHFPKPEDFFADRENPKYAYLSSSQ